MSWLGAVHNSCESIALKVFRLFPPRLPSTTTTNDFDSRGRAVPIRALFVDEVSSHPTVSHFPTHGSFVVSHNCS